MRRSPADSTKRSLAAFGKLQHIHANLTIPGSEAVLGCEILNRMTEFGRPVSYRIGR